MDQTINIGGAFIDACKTDGVAERVASDVALD